VHSDVQFINSFPVCRWCLTNVLWMYCSFFFFGLFLNDSSNITEIPFSSSSVSLQILLKVAGVMQPPRQFQPPLLSSPSTPSPSLPLLLLCFPPHHAPRVARHRRAPVRQILSLDSKVFASLFCFLEE
jgi:hypothetical protein